MMRQNRIIHWVVMGYVLLGLAVGTTSGQDTPAAGDLNRNMATQINNAFRHAIQRVMPAVVSIRVSKNVQGFFGSSEQTGLGSGCIIDSRGYVITNDHVVSGTDRVEVVLADGRVFVGQDVFLDPDTDLAIVKIDPEGEELPLASFGDSDEVQVGDFVLAMGSPFGVLEQTVTAGIVSFKGRQTGILSDRAGYEDFIQTDADINRGNSGGPLVSLYGKVIGINSNIFSPTGVSTGYGFAVPSNLAEFVTEQLIESGEVHRGWLGIRQLGLGELRTMSPRQMRMYPELWKLVSQEENFFDSLPEDLEGVLIFSVVRNDPADRAGLRRKDIILAIDGKEVQTSKDLRNTVATLRPDSSVEFTIYRNGRERMIDVTLGERTQARVQQPTKEIEPVAPMPLRPQAPQQKAKLGVAVSTLAPVIAEEYGYPEDTRGVLIQYVQAGSLAELAGMQAGEVIVAIDGRPVTNKEMLKDIIDQADFDDQGVRVKLLGLYGEREVIVKRTAD